MRAIDKGGSPYKEIDEYQDAIPYLEKKIGLYCSYCEMSIKHVPEVEHKISRKNGGDWTAWSNLLLGCKYCNTRKAAKITPQNVGGGIYGQILIIQRWLFPIRMGFQR